MLKQTIFLGLVGASAAFPLESRRDAGQVMSTYKTLTDVDMNSRIDVDYVAIDTALGTQDYKTVKSTYTSGTSAGFSIQSLSTNLGSDAAAVAALDAPGTSTGSYIGTVAAYWKANAFSGDPAVACNTACTNYGDVQTMAAINKAGMYANSNDAAREEMVGKTIVNHIAYMSAMEQLGKAVNLGKSYTAVTSGEDTAKMEIVKAIDTAWAYYAGKSSKLAVSLTVSSYAIEFGKCYDTFNGVLKSFQDAQTAANSGKMSDMNAAIAKIPGQTQVPFIQGCTRYAQLLDGTKTATEATWKNAAEAWAFCSALFPLMDSADAAKLRTMVDPSAGNTVVASEAKALLEKNYAKMGVTASDVGTRTALNTDSEKQAAIDKCSNTITAGSASATGASALLAVFAATAVVIAGARE